jgi:hypothetical protein
MALIAIASDKGAPGVTTAALALAAVWPRPVLLAECDPAGGDLVYRFPAVGGGHLDPRRGVLSLAVMARRGIQPQQLWEHTQKLHGGLDVLAGVTNAEQGAGLSLLWGPVGKVLASLPQADVIADCGRLGADGPLYDLLAEATTVVLVTRVHVADVIRLRDRSIAFAAAAHNRGRRGFGVGVVVVADHKKLRSSLGEVQHVLTQASAPAAVLGGIAHDTKGADLLSGEWGGNLHRTALIKTAREVATQLAGGLPPVGAADPAAPHNPDDDTTGPQPMLAPSLRRVSADLRPEVPPSFRPAPATSPAAAASVSRPVNYAPPAPVSAPRAAAAPAPGPGHAGQPATPYPAAASPARPAAASPAAANGAASAAGMPGAGDSATPVTPSEPLDPAPRTVFNRVHGGRSGRHHSDQEQAPQPVSRPGARLPGSPGAHAADSSSRSQDASAANSSARDPQAAVRLTASPQVPEAQTPGAPAYRPGAPAGGPEPGFSWPSVSARSNGTHRDAPSHGELSHGAPSRGDGSRGDPSRSDPARPGQLRAAPAGDAGFGGPQPQDATFGETSFGDASVRDFTRENTLHQATSHQATSHDGTSHEAASHEGTSHDGAFRRTQQPGDPAPPRPAARHAAGPSRPVASSYSRPPMSPLTPSASALDPAQRSAFPPGSAVPPATTSAGPDPDQPPGAAPPTAMPPDQPLGTSWPGAETAGEMAAANRAPGTAESGTSHPEENGWDMPSRPPSGPMDTSRPGGG